jgi:DNA-binding LacI/PurR family transcriptional regulator
MPEQGSTLYDVAVLSGLSVLGASEALHLGAELPGHQADRLSAAVGKLGYRTPVPTAGRLTGNVKIVVPTLTSWFYAQAASTAQRIFQHQGIPSTVLSFHHEPGRVPPVPGSLDQLVQQAARDTSGVLAMGLELGTPHVDALQGSGTAVLQLGQAARHLDSVGIDDELAAWTATSHLLELGHWNLALLAGTDSTMTARRAGFERALAENDVETEQDFIVTTGTSMDSGYRAMNELIAYRGRPTAVVAGCDEIAFGALKALEEHGLTAPEDLSHVGIDDHPMSSLLHLSTVAQPVEDQAAVAASLLAERILSGTSLGYPRRQLLPTTVVPRRSTRRAHAASWRR